MKYYQGKFKPKNPRKYVGDVTNIVYRSRWEFVFMRWCDSRSDIIEWSSEEMCLPYKSPIDNKAHRYFPDFIIKVKKKDIVETIMIEIKPQAQTRPPDKSRMTTKNGRRNPHYIKEVKTWGVNESKWKYATEYCKDRGWKFMIMTEKELFGKQNKTRN